MSINKLISLKNPIIDAIDMLGLDHDKDYPIFATWAIDAEKEIGSRFQYIRKHAVLTIKGCAAELPCDAMYLQRALMGDLGCDCADLFNNCFGSINTSNTFSSGITDGFMIIDTALSSNASDWTMPSYQVQDNKILFMNNYDGQSVTIQYLGIKTDCDGFVMIGENHKRAIAMYITYMWTLRKKKKSGADNSDLNFRFQQWDNLCRHARGDDNQLTEADKVEISDMMHDPTSGRSISLGMRTAIDWGGAQIF